MYILLVDDNDDLIDNLKLVLEMEGFRVKAVSNGLDALDTIRREVPSLIIADVLMPSPSGYEFFKQVKANTKAAAVPFIFLSALTTADDISRGLELGANEYVTKPFIINDLLDIMRRYLPQRS